MEYRESLEAMVKRAEELLPSDDERPFYDCFTGIRDLSRLARRDFRVVSRFYASYRTGMQKSVDLVKGRTREFADQAARTEIVRVLREAMQHRLIARLRATGVLVLADALIDNLLVRVCGKRLGVGFGPRIKDRAFTEILQAGATSSRHGHEWFNRLIAAFELSGDDSATLRAFMESDQSAVAFQHLDKRQNKSVQPILEVTSLEAFGSYDAPAATLLVLGGDHFKDFIDRFFASMIDVANHAKQRPNLDLTFKRFGAPPARIAEWEAMLQNP